MSNNKTTDLTTLVEGVKNKDTRLLARAITFCENDQTTAEKLLAELLPLTGRAHIVGVTGAPGCGKSTLVDSLANQLKKDGKSVAIVAVDPSSPFSGGAVLGDRIRMAHVAGDETLFMRSLATRGTLGGLSKATSLTVNILDAAGFDIILVETVGVGQAEVDIVRLAHTCLVVVVPGLGDSVQSIKAGVLEIGDIFVVNKADKEGADLVHKDIRNLLALVELKPEDWEPALVRTVALRAEGVPELIAQIIKHKDWLETADHGLSRKREIIKHAIIQSITGVVLDRLSHSVSIENLIDQCLKRSKTPFQAARELIKEL